MENYIAINKTLWNNKVPHHYESEFYDVANFIKGQTSLKTIELDLLGDISGKKILHLQCHFGMDSISLARMGAKVTALDFSDKAIEKANELNTLCQTNVNFVCCNVYDAAQYISDSFDIVFCSYGIIGWLEHLNPWAKIIHDFLKPSGQFIYVDFHPFVWVWDNDFNKIEYSYFNIAPIVENLTGTYAAKEAELKDTEVGFNHPTSELLNALINNGLTIKYYHEYNYSPYNCFNNCEEREPGKFYIKTFDDKMPMVYAVCGSKE
jgi:2-polyprenyl-3-methyl-5-hydroxy-6-metoxy-1,4-benzoquinol methylase